MYRLKDISDLNFYHKYSLIMLSFFLPIHQKISTIAIFICVFFSLLNIKKIKLRKNKNIILLIILFFLFSVASYRDSFTFNIKIFEQKAAFLIFPFIFLCTHISKEFFKTIFKAFVIGCVISYVILTLNALYLSFDFNSFDFNPFLTSLEAKESFLGEHPLQTNLFLGRIFTGDMQPTLLSIYFIFSIAIVKLLDLGFNNFFKRVITIILFVGVLQIFSLISVIALIFALMIIYGIVSYIKSLYFIWLSFSLILLLILTFPNLNQRLPSGVLLNNVESRIIIWETALKTISEKPLLGYGKKKAQKALESLYPKRGFFGAVSQSRKMDAHNVVLQTLLEIGIMGFAVLGILFLRLIRKRHGPLLGIFAVLVSLVSITESILNIYVGLSFFVFFYCLFNEVDF